MGFGCRMGLCSIARGSLNDLCKLSIYNVVVISPPGLTARAGQIQGAACKVCPSGPSQRLVMGREKTSHYSGRVTLSLARQNKGI